LVNVREERGMAGLKAGFIQFAETVFAGEQAPLYERLSRGVAEDDDLLSLAAETKVGQYPAYILFAAVHYLLLADPSEPLADFYANLREVPSPPDGAFPIFQEFCARHGTEIRDIVSTRLVQTNEVGRSACLTPAFAYVARLVGDSLLHLIDIGAAAGLNLLFDRYFLDYGRLEWGDPASRVRIACELRSDATLPLDGWQPNVCHRMGVDLNPVDVTSENDARWLRALVWPEQLERADVLAQAMAVAAQDPPQLIRGDAVALLPGLLAEVPVYETPCIYHSYTLEYFSEDARRKFHQILDDFGAERNLYFVEMSGIEPNGSVRLTSWRDGEREMLRLAECPPHGQWLRWLV
jgi:hypothetical protein